MLFRLKGWTVGLALALGAALFVTLLAPGASAQMDSEEWAQLVEAARQEGTLVLYDGHGGLIPTIRYAAERLQEEYGIEVQLSVMRASEAVERVRIEQRAGRPLADLVTTGFTTSWQMKFYDDTLQPIGPLPSLSKVNPSVVQAMKDADIDDIMLTEAVQIYGILINTELVPPEEEPKSWRDLLNPKFAFNMIADDPRAPGGGFVFFSASYDNLGREFHEALAAQRPFFTRAAADAANRVARGEFAVMFPFALGLYPNVKDLPNVKVIVPEEGAPFVLQGVGIPRNVRHPNAARLMAEFLLSEEIQRSLAGDVLLPVIPGTPLDLVPEEVRPYFDVHLWGTTTPPRSEEYLKIAAEIYQ